MAAKLRRYCDEELAALDQRIGVLVGDANLQGEANPFSPQAICNAFKQTCRGLEPNLKARMILHKLFDDHVLDDIRPIFKDLNTLLVERSILPKIRYGVARHSGAGLIGPRAPGAMASARCRRDQDWTAWLCPGAYPGAAAAGEQDMFAMLQNLVAMNLGAAPGGVARVRPGCSRWAFRAQAFRGWAFPALAFRQRACRVHRLVAGAGIAGAAGLAAGGVPVGGVTQVPGFPPIIAGGPASALAGPMRMLQGAELLSSLTRIQHGDVSVVAGGDLPLAATLVQPGTTNVLRELKSTSLASGMEQMDSMTLDIVAMLFDQIFGDENIPIAMKGLIGRLQIPMLKVAILDKNFFSKKTHPARQLLDVLGEIAVGLNAEFDQASPLYKHIDKVVQRLVDGFQDSMDIFDPLREELEALHRRGEPARRGRSQDQRPAHRAPGEARDRQGRCAAGDPAARQVRHHPARSAQVSRRAVGQAAAGGACQARRDQRGVEERAWKPWTC